MNEDNCWLRNFAKVLMISALVFFCSPATETFSMMPTPERPSFGIWYSEGKQQSKSGVEHYTIIGTNADYFARGPFGEKRAKHSLTIEESRLLSKEIHDSGFFSAFKSHPPIAGAPIHIVMGNKTLTVVRNGENYLASDRGGSGCLNKIQ